ncbi:hypothetical protein VCUG_00612 [Vavraia culicis subsp. floridensis]|uniref:LSM complex subunit LSM4 n=1 Tax=Vavraia culicis (isolate floridensis) TaxID=948595 RepID=L2GX34_VAVCU|nr:uncharacterized protein VCUG_00612 [Vavraia culicis subsp. floridensis]ELA47892.1 hypothetical protein VCUG_00612 [Vavraia culicis subsp. floridensis]
MYPVTLVRISKGSTIDVELKNNDTYRGTLVACDLLMNLRLRNVRLVNGDGEKDFSECILRGSAVKHIKLNNKVLYVQEMVEKKRLMAAEYD